MVPCSWDHSDVEAIWLRARYVVYGLCSIRDALGSIPFAKDSRHRVPRPHPIQRQHLLSSIVPSARERHLESKWWWLIKGDHSSAAATWVNWLLLHWKWGQFLVCWIDLAYWTWYWRFKFPRSFQLFAKALPDFAEESTPVQSLHAMVGTGMRRVGHI